MAAFDGQGSGGNFYGVGPLLRSSAERTHVHTPDLHACEQNMWEPSHGWVNSTDGGRGHVFGDYQQQ